MDLLKPLYHEFDKSYIAQFCAHIAKRINPKKRSIIILLMIIILLNL